jgi:hypothetical protein
MARDVGDMEQSVQFYLCKKKEETTAMKAFRKTVQHGGTSSEFRSEDKFQSTLQFEIYLQWFGL